MKKILIFIITFVIGLISLWWATSQVGFHEVGQAFAHFPTRGLFWVFLITFLIVLVNIFRLRFIMKKISCSLPFWKVGEIWLSGFTISFLTPISLLGGEFYMMYAIRKIFSIPWSKSIAAVFINRILDAVLFLTFLFLGMFIFFSSTTSLISKKILALGGGMIVLLVSFLALFFLKSSRKESVLAWFIKLFGFKKEKFENSMGGEVLFRSEKRIFDFLTENKKDFIKGLGLSLIKYSLIFLRVMVILYFFGFGFNIVNSASVYGFFNFCSIIPLPALLGSLEIVEGGVFKALGMGANFGIAFAFLIRGVELILVFIGLILILRFSVKVIKIRIDEFLDKISKF